MTVPVETELTREMENLNMNTDIQRYVDELLYRVGRLKKKAKDVYKYAKEDDFFEDEDLEEDFKILKRFWERFEFNQEGPFDEVLNLSWLHDTILECEDYDAMHDIFFVDYYFAFMKFEACLRAYAEERGIRV